MDISYTSPIKREHGLVIRFRYDKEDMSCQLKHTQKHGLYIHTAEIKDLMEHFVYCDEKITLSIEKQLPLIEYAEKLVNLANLYEYWENDMLIGFGAVYENRGIEKPAFLTLLTVDIRKHGKGIASNIIKLMIESLKSKNYSLLKTTVRKDNSIAIRLYEKFGFSIEKELNENVWRMQLLLN